MTSGKSMKMIFPSFYQLCPLNHPGAEKRDCFPPLDLCWALITRRPDAYNFSWTVAQILGGLLWSPPGHELRKQVRTYALMLRFGPAMTLFWMLTAKEYIYSWAPDSFFEFLHIFAHLFFQTYFLSQFSSSWSRRKAVFWRFNHHSRQMRCNLDETTMQTTLFIDQKMNLWALRG